jgi:hypothetical protein
MATSMEASSDAAPLRVVASNATPEEIAALVAVLASLQTPTTPVYPEPPGWSDSTRSQRRALPHGSGGWRSSSLPR